MTDDFDAGEHAAASQVRAGGPDANVRDIGLIPTCSAHHPSAPCRPAGALPHVGDPHRPVTADRT